MRYLIRGKFTSQALRSIQEQGMVDRVERAKERFRAMGAEIKQAYFVPTTGGLELKLGEARAIPVTELKAAHEGWFPRFMDS